MVPRPQTDFGKRENVDFGDPVSSRGQGLVKKSTQNKKY